MSATNLGIYTQHKGLNNFDTKYKMHIVVSTYSKKEKSTQTSL